MEDVRNTYKILVWYLEEWMLLVSSTKSDHKQCWVDVSGSGWALTAGSHKHGYNASCSKEEKVGHFWTRLATVGFSRRTLLVWYWTPTVYWWNIVGIIGLISMHPADYKLKSESTRWPAAQKDRERQICKVAMWRRGFTRTGNTMRD
jgi:hypothetical protein